MKRIFYILFLLWLPLLALAQKQSNDADKLEYPVPESYQVTFSPQGWATFNSPYAVTIDDNNVKVYIVTNSSAGAVSPADYVATLHLVQCPTVTINGVTKRYIPQRDVQKHTNCVNPVVLRYDEEALKTNSPVTITLKVLLEDDTYDPKYQKCLYKSYLDQPNGLLLGADDVPYEKDTKGESQPIKLEDDDWPYHALGAVDGDFHTYVLGFTQTYGMAFYEVKPGSALPANRAYIEIAISDATQHSPRFTIEIDDDPTGLSNSPLHTSNVKDSFIRDLWGHPVITPQRGQVYIKDNHKYLHQ